ncbi:MAG: GNAT family N-acetyltransferase [Nocardioides sp.]
MSPDPAGPRPPGLGPHCVGTRVVVRRLLRGSTGPTGGPAMTDLLGVMESWDPPTTSVRAEDGTLVVIALADIVSGKPVPPRPSVRLRASADEAERVALGSWRAVETQPLGDWVLRASGGGTARANSVLASGDPGLPLPDALAAVREFYAARGLPAWAQVVVGSAEEAAVVSAGWVTARPGEADTVFEVASVARASRAARSLLPQRAPAAVVSPGLTDGWLADVGDGHVASPQGRAVLEGSIDTGFVTVGSPVVAKGRVALTGGADPWAGITDVWVSPAHRRHGLALLVMAELLEWAAERGATTVFLQARGDNPAALALYERLGFAEHHRYRYLAPAG